MKLIQIYNDKVANGTLAFDDQQQDVLLLLQNLYEALMHYHKMRRRFGRLLAGAWYSPPQGIYLYGGVGCGKSMLMDLFYEALSITKKRRVHFHAFMQELHENMHKARGRGTDDALRSSIKGIIQNTTVLCIDEVYITDITDAMIVGRLFDLLISAGVVVVCTSNCHPDQLYKNGLNRNLFLPFIQILQDKLAIICLDSQTDHRKNRLNGQQRYFYPLNDKTHSEIEALWHIFSGGHCESIFLINKKRKIHIPAYANGAARVCFDDLCARPLGASDYLLIAQSFRILMISDVPQMSHKNSSEAKRFITLIDVLYEAKTQVIISAEVPPDKLYQRGSVAFEFERTISRLLEMQSQDWISYGL